MKNGRGEKMHIVFRSDVGKRRKNNQDFAGYFVNQQGITLAVLCDGMGGHKAGDVASEMAVSHLGHAWEKTETNTIEAVSQWIQDRIKRENERIVEKSNQFPDLEGMGTTLVAAAFIDNQFVVANIGDSRAYQYMAGRLKQLTEDHSLVNELLKSGEISTEGALNHPQKNVLTRSLGVSKEVNADLMVVSALEGDQLLLCSDGLTNMVEDQEIAEILSDSHMSLEEKVTSLVSLANARGGYDNITVMLTDFTERKEGE